MLVTGLPASAKAEGVQHHSQHLADSKHSVNANERASQHLHSGEGGRSVAVDKGVAWLRPFLLRGAEREV